MTTKFTVEIKFGSRWEEMNSFRTLNKAYDFIGKKVQEHGNYPFRIVRVTRTIMFGETK